MSNRNIIVIGGSAGATAPLRKILGRLPVDLPAAVFIVLHMPAQGVGILSTVASTAGPLPVRQAESGMVIENGHAYLAAPDHHLLVLEDRIMLGLGPPENMVRPAIDPLFRSAALHHGPRVVGVVLSGRLSDGASGLDAIRRCGGFTLVQDPQDAIADEMPLRALEATAVDLCVPGARIGDALFDLTRERAGAVPLIPPEIRLQVEIAAGEPIRGDRLSPLANPAVPGCPSCSGVLSQIRNRHPPQLRGQLGRDCTADALAREYEGSVDEALRVALRIIEERAELVHGMAEVGRRSGRVAFAQMYAARAAEYREYADTIRRVMLQSREPAAPAAKQRSA